MTSKALALAAGLFLATISACKTDTRAPDTERAKAEASDLAEQAKTKAKDLAQQAKQAGSKVGDNLAQAANEVKSKLDPLMSSVGDSLKEVGDKVGVATKEQQHELARKTRRTVDDVQRWVDDEAKPKAAEGVDNARDGVRDLAHDLGEKLDRVQNESGPAAERTWQDIKDGLARLKDKLQAAGSR